MNKPILKFCGVQNLQDLQVVSDSIADYVGFIFAESKRKVHPLRVREWMNEVKTTKKIVAVFVNPTEKELFEVLEHVPVDVIQFHGNESIEQVSETRHSFKGAIWKALHHHENTLAEMEKYLEFVDGYVVDSRMKGQWGGTGVRFDWNAVPKYINFAKTNDKLCFIAGGVNEQNISELLAYDPKGIDLSSGIEANQQKSKEMIQLIEERMLQYVKLSRS